MELDRLDFWLFFHQGARNARAPGVGGEGGGIVVATARICIPGVKWRFFLFVFHYPLFSCD